MLHLSKASAWLAPLAFVFAISGCSPSKPQPSGAKNELPAERVAELQSSLSQPEGEDKLRKALEGKPPTKADLTKLLDAAAGSGSREAAKLLVEKGADPNGSGDGYPLVSAATAGDAELVDLLIEKGADVNLRIDRKPTALAALAAIQRPEMLKRLLEKGADPNLVSYWKDRWTHVLSHGNPALEIVDRRWTPLTIAASKGLRENVEVLLEHGAKLGSIENEDSAYAVAKSRGHKDLLPLLKP